MIAPIDYRLRRNAFGRLELTTADGQTHLDVVPVRAFPISAADDGIGLVDPHGRELAWIERLSELPDELRRLVETELAQREFMPEIRRITDVSSFATPSTWQVETDRGSSRFVLKGEEDIRRGRGRHSPPGLTGAADRRQPWHPVPDPRPLRARPAQPADSGPLPVNAAPAVLAPGGKPIAASRVIPTTITAAAVLLSATAVVLLSATAVFAPARATRPCPE